MVAKTNVPLFDLSVNVECDWQSRTWNRVRSFHVLHVKLFVLITRSRISPWRNIDLLLELFKRFSSVPSTCLKLLFFFSRVHERPTLSVLLIGIIQIGTLAVLPLTVRKIFYYSEKQKKRPNVMKNAMWVLYHVSKRFPFMLLAKHFGFLYGLKPCSTFPMCC